MHACAAVWPDFAPTYSGGVAQLGEHLPCTQGVVGSIPVASTTLKNERPGHNMHSRKPLLPEQALDGDSRVAKPAHYLRYYEQYFASLVEQEINFLELGVYKGDSLELFARYFENGLIIGLDANPVEREFATARIKFYQGLQTDSELFERIWLENKISWLDIVIDDCSHIGSCTLESFKLLFPKLKAGGQYVIEDWGTGYWPKWPGGKLFDPSRHLSQQDEEFSSHQAGIPGLIKQMVDEVGMADIADRRGLDCTAASLFEYVHVYPGIVFIKKA